MESTKEFLESLWAMKKDEEWFMNAGQTPNLTETKQQIVKAGRCLDLVKKLVPPETELGKIEDLAQHLMPVSDELLELIETALSVNVEFKINGE